MWAEPEVVFRIVHVALADGEPPTDGSPPIAYREQTVEISLGPTGAFENGNVGTLTRRVPANRVVSGVPAPRHVPKPPKPPRKPRTPRVAELLRKAIEWRRQLDTGEVPNQAAIACREGISRARITQVLGLLRLATPIQDVILAMPKTTDRPAISESALRRVIQIEDSEEQRAAVSTLIHFEDAGKTRRRR